MQVKTDSPDAGRSMGSRMLIRVLIYAIIIAAILLVMESPFQRAEAEPEQTQPVYKARNATAEEWALPLAELGKRQLAKKLIYFPMRISYGPNYPGVKRRQVESQGDLIWWHGKQGEAVCYLPAPGEGPEKANELIYGIVSSQVVVLTNHHGDATLRERLAELSNAVVPEGWTLLLPPSQEEPKSEAASK